MSNIFLENKVMWVETWLSCSFTLKFIPIIVNVYRNVPVHQDLVEGSYLFHCFERFRIKYLI